MIKVGDRLDGKYVVKRLLGAGGFGQVYLADDDALSNRPVAIKVLARPDSIDQNALIWEMQHLSRLSHPNVVSFYHYFEHGEKLCLVMEFCPGGSLDDRICVDGPAAVEQVFEWGLRLCDTLGFVHSNEIVHHDIKPNNILFSADGVIKLGDFGVANLRAGTRVYMPPEMLLGGSVSRTDPRVDIYSLGLTLLEALTGNNPLLAVTDGEEIFVRTAHEFVPSDLPQWVQEVLLKATHPIPELRFQSMGELAEAIRSKHVPMALDGSRIKADGLAILAEKSLARKKWRRAAGLVELALGTCPHSISALLAAGRLELLMRRTERARDYFNSALRLSPRTPIQKELGWINLEQGRMPAAISLLSDHLQRHPSDFEAYNLLLKCFYLTGRYEAGTELARAVLRHNPPNGCFSSNEILCRLLETNGVPSDLDPGADCAADGPFVAYNLLVANERESAWKRDGVPSLASKLLFEEYRFANALKSGQSNTILVTLPDGRGVESAQPIVSVGSLKGNDIALDGSSVSRRHGAIVNFRDEVWVYDLGSTMGTAVDGRKVHGRQFLDGVHEVTFGRVPLQVASKRGLLI